MGEILKQERPEWASGLIGEERIASIDDLVEIQRCHQYFMALELCRGKAVLDIAYGQSYGPEILSKVARLVVSVDCKTDALLHPRWAHPFSNLRFVTGDVGAIPLRDASIDIAIFFETLERIYEPHTFIAEIKRVLRPDGIFVISIPEKDIYSPSNSTGKPTDVRYWTKQELTTSLRRSFQYVECLLQRAITESVILSNQTDVYTGSAQDAVDLLAFASGQPLELLPAALHPDARERAARQSELSAANEQLGREDRRYEQLERKLANLRAEQEAGTSNRGQRIARGRPRYPRALRR
jgi:O-antigen biosynthesis protein